MSESALKINISDWVGLVKTDNMTYRQRQATEIILTAIAITPPLKNKLYLKGGVLMGLVHDSPRQTSDIDFSVAISDSPNENTADSFEGLMNSALLRAAAMLGYADMVLSVQSTKGKPSKYYPNAHFPALKLKIGYAQRGSNQENRLRQRNAPDVISLDISYNEQISDIQILNISDEISLLAYSPIDLIAEKYRAIFQQKPRGRNRRQDVYDLDFIIQKTNFDNETKANILAALIEKCQSRNIKPTQDSIDDPEIKRRSGSEWRTLELDIGKVPDFDACFERVATFYRQLPWPLGSE